MSDRKKNNFGTKMVFLTGAIAGVVGGWAVLAFGMQPNASANANVLYDSLGQPLPTLVGQPQGGLDPALSLISDPGTSQQAATLPPLRRVSRSQLLPPFFINTHSS